MNARTSFVAIGLLIAAAGPAARQADPVDRRIADRIRALQQEATDLASREKTLLNELRQFEIQREIKTEELAAIDAELASAERDIATLTSREAALRQSAQDQRPDVEARLVGLYKMGRGGYWRMLLDVDDLVALGRAYRTAAALTTISGRQIRQHQQTVESLAQERKALDERVRSARSLRERQRGARAALDAAVASRGELVRTIDARRDLAAQFIGELRSAQQRLQATGGPPAAGSVPFLPFKGALPWPAEGIVTVQFGKPRRTLGKLSISSAGIEMSLAEGRPVAAIHEATVREAGPFAGLGNVVVLDHGGSATSLYGQLSAVSVKKGDQVRAGGTVGRSGRNIAGNPALYFELRIDGQPVDPLQWLRKQP